MEPLLALIGAGVCLAVPIAVIVLWNRLNALEAQVRQLSLGEPRPRPTPPPAAAVVPPVATTPTPATPAPAPLSAAPAPVASAPVAPTPLPPPLPTTPPPVAAPTRPVAAPAPTAPVASGPKEDPWAGLRRLGLLPPADLRGEFALGSWWAIRLAGVLAVAAVVFLAVWLNLRSTLPPWLRLAEILTLGGLALGGGLRLERTRRDLGRVVFAVGLTVFQFAAWAAHGLERMRVLDTAVAAATWQFLAALAVGAVALVRRDRLIGQLAVAFAAVAAVLSVRAGTEPLSVGLEAGSIALLGGVLLARGGWTSAAALSLASSLVALVWLRLERPDVPGVGLAGQVGAALIFVSLWLGDRLGPAAEAAATAGRNALLALAFLAPATLAVWVTPGGDHAHALAAGVVALVAVAVGLGERSRRRPAADLLLASALFFGASAAAWWAEPRLVWLAWFLAAALAQLLHARLALPLLPWAARLLTLVGVLAYLLSAPTTLWVCLLAPATLGALVAWRLRTTADTGVDRFGMVLDLVGLGVLTCFVQGHRTDTQQAWAWLVVAPSAFLFRRPALLWALVPSILWTHVTILLTGPEGGLAGERGLMLGWALLLVVLHALFIRFAESWHDLTADLLRPVSAFVAGCMLSKGLDLALVFPPNADDWRAPLLWGGGALLTYGLAEGLRRLTSCELSPWAAILPFWPAFLFVHGDASWSAPTPAMMAVWLGAQALALFGFARFQRSASPQATTLAGIFATLIGATVAFAFADLGAGENALGWALAASVTCLLGRVLGLRAYGVVGLIGLLLASLLGLATSGSAGPAVYLTLALLELAMVWWLEEWPESAARVAQHTLALLAAVFGLIALGKFLGPRLAPHLLAASVWCGGAALVAALGEAFLRGLRRPSLGISVLAALFPTFRVLKLRDQHPAGTLATTPLWLLGLGLALFALARHSRDTGKFGTLVRSLLGVAFLGLTLAAFDDLTGAQVSLFWALAAALTFALGLWLGTRSYRMLGLLGLLLATSHVILYDVHDLLGRIVASAALAAAFFGVAWLYGRFVKKDSGAGN